MTTLMHPDEVKQYLAQNGWIASASQAIVVPLTGGVSNQVWKIETADGQRYVMKQALKQLKVKEAWFSDVGRILREQLAMKTMSAYVPEGVIPQIIRSDPKRHIYMMTCAPEEAVTWKSQLLLGQFNERVARKLGALLSHIHTRSAAQPLDADFADLTYFKQLRIEPFYDYLRDRAYPDLAPRINELSAQLTQDSAVLVHGDFSPKNILVDRDESLIILDFEVAHRGNPVFDIAFCAAHLMLKGWVLNRKAAACALIEAFMEGYGQATLHDLHAHLGVMLLARIDGKSPVEYMSNTSLKDEVRNAGKHLLQKGPGESLVDQIKHIWGDCS